MLDDKNADIDMLKSQVDLLKKQVGGNYLIELRFSLINENVFNYRCVFAN